MNGRRAPRNRTLVLAPPEIAALAPLLGRLDAPTAPAGLFGRVFHQDCQSALAHLPAGFVDLLFLDPPYNLAKNFNGRSFQRRPVAAYTQWMESWFVPLLRVLKPTASIYVCGDWRSSASIFQVLQEHAIIRNRITWEREKGRGAKANWKNCAEDIWFATVSDRYCFDPEAVRLKRRVRAPYRVQGRPKDWQREAAGNFRLTHASNFWSDLTVPFWSMPENTDHPAQKPEKLLAKLMLASSRPGDVILDPFLGSGTAAVVAQKLGRRFVGFERERAYCLLALKRLALAARERAIQGYADGVFWERNSTPTPSASDLNI